MEPHGLSAAEEGGDAPLTRVLGLWQFSLAGIGIILGAGIYALLPPAAALAGNAVWVSFLIAAAVAAVSGPSYAELAAMVPKAGAEYDYAGRALGERGGVAAVLTVPAEIEFLASATNFLIFTTFIAVNVSVVVLRRTEPDTRPPFRVAVAVRGVPILPLVGVAASIGLMVQLDPAVLLAGLAISGGATAMAVLSGRRRPRRDR